MPVRAIRSAIRAISDMMNDLPTGHHRYAVLAEGKFSPLKSKTANQVIRYAPDQVAAVIDSTQAGMVASQVLGFGGEIPVVPDVDTAMEFAPDTLLVGIAPAGGQLPPEWRGIVLHAIHLRLNIVSGLHTFLSEDPEFIQAAKMCQSTVTDLRKVPKDFEIVARGSWKNRRAKTILTVGTDCNVGKMTASLELHREFVRRGLASEFVATGQTGILLSGKGIAVDSLPGDYIAGAIEREIDLLTRPDVEYLHIEGQGSLTHQGYSSVTLGLIHGVMPDAMVLVHHPARLKDDYGFSLTDVRPLIRLHESLLTCFKPSRIVAIAVNTVGMSRKDVETAKEQLNSSTGLPVGDVLTPDIQILADALLMYLRNIPSLAD